MTTVSARARLLLRHIATALGRSVPILELVQFSPADGDIGNAKGEARDNAEAIEQLIKADLVSLWVEDHWEHPDSDHPERTSVVWPELVLTPTEQGRAVAGWET